MAEIVIPEMKIDFELDEIVMPTHMNNIGKAINTLKAQAIELGQIDIIQTLNNLGKQINELYAKGGVADGKIADILESIQGILTELGNKANVGPPQEYDLVLTTGLIVATGEAKYSKNQFGKVKAYGEVKKNDLSDFVSGTELDIAYLPEGFKPKTYTVGQATIRETGSASMKMQPVRVIADTDGSIHVLLGQLSSGFKCISFYITFYNYV